VSAIVEAISSGISAPATPALSAASSMAPGQGGLGGFASLFAEAIGPTPHAAPIAAQSVNGPSGVGCLSTSGSSVTAPHAGNSQGNGAKNNLTTSSGTALQINQVNPVQVDPTVTLPILPPLPAPTLPAESVATIINNNASPAQQRAGLDALTAPSALTTQDSVPSSSATNQSATRLAMAGDSPAPPSFANRSGANTSTVEPPTTSLTQQVGSVGAGWAQAKTLAAPDTSSMASALLVDAQVQDAQTHSATSTTSVTGVISDTQSSTPGPSISSRLKFSTDQSLAPQAMAAANSGDIPTAVPNASVSSAFAIDRVIQASTKSTDALSPTTQPDIQIRAEGYPAMVNAVGPSTSESLAANLAGAIAAASSSPDTAPGSTYTGVLGTTEIAGQNATTKSAQNSSAPSSIAAPPNPKLASVSNARIAPPISPSSAAAPPLFALAAESALGNLPKTLLANIGSAIRAGASTNSTANFPNAASTPQNNVIQSVSSQTATAANSKPPTPTTANQNNSGRDGQPTNRDGTSSLASAQTVVPQAAAAQTTASSPSAALPAALAGIPATGTASAVKPDPSTTPSSANLPASPQATEPAATSVLGQVQMAQLVSRGAQAEMRIGLSTSAFGSVEVRTVVHASDIGLIIGSEKGDLHSLLANEIPVIANTLQQQNLRLNSVNFHQGFAFSNNSAGGGDSQRRYAPPLQIPTSYAAREAATENSIESVLQATPRATYTGLSILA
jgi:hypothetical protein